MPLNYNKITKFCNLQGPTNRPTLTKNISIDRRGPFGSREAVTHGSLRRSTMAEYVCCCYDSAPLSQDEWNEVIRTRDDYQTGPRHQALNPPHPFLGSQTQCRPVHQHQEFPPQNKFSPSTNWLIDDSSACTAGSQST